MKRIFAFLMMVIIVLSLCACSAVDSTPTQHSKENDITKYLGTYITVGIYDENGDNILPYYDDPDDTPLIILEENNVAKMSLIPSSGVGATYYYTIEHDLLKAELDSNCDGIPEGGEGAGTFSGIFQDDGLYIRIGQGVMYMYHLQKVE